MSWFMYKLSILLMFSIK